jgi:hypothetical protein
MKAPKDADQVWAQVRHLLLGQTDSSRNRRYLEFASPDGQRVLKLFRQYQSLLLELEQAAARGDMEVSAKQEPSGLMLSVKDPKVNYRRACQVPPPLADLFWKRLTELGLVKTSVVTGEPAP